ncbi:hypothetical protein MIR68_000060 [Amoeboaphelidium protococcarum]|nr:hypothetical protein MIR68_000060 [Amoeboaphelidium protococcarum]
MTRLNSCNRLYQSLQCSFPRRQIQQRICDIRLRSGSRFYASQRQFLNSRNRQQIDTASIVLYASSVLVGVVGLTYAAVPLYRLFCAKTGLGGTPMTANQQQMAEAASKMVPVKDARKIRVSFNADTSQTMQWKFQPLQKEVFVYPGETSLVFYHAVNPTDTDIVGISTYNVLPLRAGAYFNKIQCFCFEEQRLKAGESVDMPVFFFLDPAIDEDPQMADVTDITLSYTFFNAQHANGSYLSSPAVQKDGQVQSV